ncbi:MAG: hypothetical protein HIU83_01000 [Proteobacteria bacterium]|nr:hypothetical protein [Pseudomonadota bacterium]
MSGCHWKRGVVTSCGPGCIFYQQEGFCTLFEPCQTWPASFSARYRSDGDKEENGQRTMNFLRKLDFPELRISMVFLTRHLYGQG